MDEEGKLTATRNDEAEPGQWLPDMDVDFPEGNLGLKSSKSFSNSNFNEFR